MRNVATTGGHRTVPVTLAAVFFFSMDLFRFPAKERNFALAAARSCWDCTD